MHTSTLYQGKSSADRAAPVSIKISSAAAGCPGGVRKCKAGNTGGQFGSWVSLLECGAQVGGIGAVHQRHVKRVPLAGVRPAASAWRHIAWVARKRGVGLGGRDPAAMRWVRTSAFCSASCGGWPAGGGCWFSWSIALLGVAHPRVVGGGVLAGVRGSSRLRNDIAHAAMGLEGQPAQRFVGGRADVDRLQVVVWHDCASCIS